MATYEEIHGKRVETFSSDPTLDSSYEGQVWFNSTSGTLKTVVQSAAWVSQTPSSSQHGDGTGCGTASATLLWGGYAPSNQQPPSGYTTTSTEEFNGSGWTAGGNYPVSFFRAGSAGTQTAALGIAGRTGNPAANQDDCFKYDGSTWTATTNYPASKNGVGATGTQTAAIAVGGAPYVDTSFEFDGSSWTSSGTYPTARVGIRGAGTQTAGIFAGGSEPVVSTATTYDGSSFSVVGSLNTARTLTTHSGNSGSSVLCGGALPPGPSNATERWDGTSWTTSPATMSTGGFGGGAGAMSNPAGNTSALMGALRGPPSSYPTNIEEFSVSTNFITAAAWASGATYPLSLNQLGGSGTQTAGLCFGGNLPPGNPNGSNQTKEYDGSAWTAGGNLNIGKDTGSRSGVGTQTASMAINFRNDGSPPVSPVNYIAMTNVEEYNGSSWTAGTATPDGEVEAGTCGTISAALRFGGNPGNPPGGPYTNSTIYWNDSSWTSLNNMSTARSGLAPAFQGTYNAALGFGGETATPTEQTATEEFDGTNWTTGGNMVTAVSRHSGSGIQTAALAFGGTPSITRTEGYDGTAWSTRPSLANGRSFGGGAGSSTAALYMCGDGTTHVEEFTGETTAANVKTITTS